MEKKNLKSKKLPTTPGVYFFKRGRTILYIGKATSLKSRVQSYFSSELIATRGPTLVKMLSEATSVSVQETDSVLEALILEANLIKKHQPFYNTREKDNKSFNYVVITDEDFPRVLTIRGRDLELGKVPAEKIKYQFGPFPQGGMFKEAMKLIRKLFPFFDTKSPVATMAKRKKNTQLLNQQIGLMPSFDIDKKEYARTIQHLRLFFEGKKKALIKKLEQEMKSYAKKQEFEKATKIKKTLFGLTHIQDIALLKRENNHNTKKGIEVMRVEAYDVAHTGGTNTVGVMAVILDGEASPSEYRLFNITSDQKGSDTHALTELLTRRLGHPEWHFPHLIVIDGGKAQLSTAQKVLDSHGIKIPLVSVVKDDRHRPREILGSKKYTNVHEPAIILANAEAHRFAVAHHRKRRSKLSLSR